VPRGTKRNERATAYRSITYDICDEGHISPIVLAE
jgi:hypothetical protein